MRCLVIIAVGLALSTELVAGFRSDTTDRERARVELAKAQLAFKQRGETKLRQALAHYQAACELDESLAEAHAGVATAASLLALYGYERPNEFMPKARAAADRALRLRHDLAEADAARGLVAYLYEWDFSAAETHFARALEHRPNYPEARHWYAMLLRATGRFDEAIKQIELAIFDAPGVALYAVKRGTILLAANRVEAAAQSLDETLRLHPHFAMAHRERGFVDLERGELEKALSFVERSLEISGAAKTKASGFAIRAQLGDPSPAAQMLGALDSSTNGAYQSPLVEAILHVGTGSDDSALRAIERAFEQRDPAVVYLSRHPSYIPLRSDHRFQALLRTAGLPMP